MNDLVYLDNAATTRVDPEVARAAVAAMTETYGNPSSAHRFGLEAARLVATAREQVARILSADPGEIVFTSGGTEANALGVRGATGKEPSGRHLVISGVEHPSVSAATKHLAERGCEVTVVGPEPSGIISPEKLAAAVRPTTVVCALLWVQNELGTIQPVAEAARAIKAVAPRCHVHVDAVQGLGKLKLDVTAWRVDSIAVSAHKIHGPKGVGALWVRAGSRLEPLLHGGGQERGLRPGTEPVPGIVALGRAVELAARALPEAAPRMAALRERLWTAIRERVPSAMRHGDPARVAPHLISIGFPHVPAEPMLHALEARAVFVSAGSACAARERRPSSVLRAIGVPDHVGTLRFSLSRLTTEAEVERAAVAVAEAVRELS